MPSTDCSTPDFNTEIPQQIPQLKLAVTQFAATTSPYLNVVDGGTVENNQGELIRTITPGRMVTNQSYAAPAFQQFLGACNPAGATAQFGSHTYEAQLEYLSGRGPDICVTQARSTVLGMYSSAEKRLKDAITELKGQDIANQFSLLSGAKVRLSSTANSVTDIISGDEWEVGVNYPNGLPDAGINWSVLHAVDSYVRDNWEVETWGTGDGAYAAFIGSSEAIEALRNDANVNGDYGKATQGSFATEKNALFKRYFDGIAAYRGIKWTVDRKPKRFNTVDGNGNPVFIEPYVNVVADNGQVRKTNPVWVNARYEIGFLVYKNAFKYLVPKQYLGEGSFKFPAQMYAGDLEWLNIKTDCNPFQDTGYHIWRSVRAFQPVVPHAVIPFMIKRCAPAGFGTTPCATVS